VGDNSPRLNDFIHTTTLVVLTGVLIAQQAACDTTSKNTMPTNAQEYIAAFKRGEEFAPPAGGVIVNGQPDSAALKVLGQELSVANPAVREKIVALLVDIGLQTDPLKPKGTEVLRDPQIIALLATAGLSKPDLGRQAAMEALRKLVTQRDLAGFDDAFVKVLENAPTSESFLLVAKAKPQKAKDLVDRLTSSAQWKDVEAAKIARAAFGARDVEDQFLAAAAAAREGKALAKSLGPLALIGTPRTLRAIAEFLRTPLTIHIPGAFEKSVRLNVLEALLYNFPDQPIFYPNNIIKDADYAAAENFCIRTLGANYSTPRPPFMTVRGYPIPLPK
jgi:hypothetical protein